MAAFVSVIIPCRNEEKFIAKCLDSLLKQDYPKEYLEILVIDGDSADKTREIIREYEAKVSFVRLLNNPKRYTPFGLNIGIKEARGEIIVRMDAHAGYENDYISKCVDDLEEYDVDNVGGVIKTLPSKNTLTAKAIALALSHSFGAGGSMFRVGAKGKTLVDTVFGGCYKKELFNEVGLFNEKMLRSQDMEFNKRLKKSGGKILLDPAIVARYYPQSTLFGFWKHNFLDGTWTTYPLKFGIKFFSTRHLVPLFFISGLFLGIVLSFFFSWAKVLFVLAIALYILASMYFSFITAAKNKEDKLFFAMPLAFFVRHFGYGLGSLYGLLKYKVEELLKR